MSTRHLLGCAAALGAFACATVDPSRELAEVRRALSDRSVPTEEAPSTEVADMRVRELLGSPLTAESAIRVAFLRNRRLGAALAEVGIAQAELAQAALPPNPILSAEARFGIGESGVGAEVDLMQELVSALQIPLQKRIAEAELEATKLAVGAALFELASEVKEAFFEAQAAAQSLEVRRGVAEAAGLGADVARRQHEAGNITDVAFAEQQALHEEAKLELAEAEVHTLESRERVTSVMGLWGEDTRWELEPFLTAVPSAELRFNGLESLAVERRLDLAEARQRTASAARSVALTRFYGLIPEAETGLHSEREVEGGWSVGPSLDIPIPLFDQGQARIAVARGLERRTEDEFAALAVQIRSEVRTAWARLQAARSRALYYDRVVLPLRSRIVEGTLREYNAMLVGVHQLLEAKRGEIEASADRIEALRGYWVSRVALERALGTALPVGAAPTPSRVPAIEPPRHQHDHHQHHEG
jgi:cobalt-zinc-cadmium efflux system outer membrane protein